MLQPPDSVSTSAHHVPQVCGWALKGAALLSFSRVAAVRKNPGSSSLPRVDAAGEAKRQAVGPLNAQRFS
jgi:hypothetical protein